MLLNPAGRTSASGGVTPVVSTTSTTWKVNGASEPLAVTLADQGANTSNLTAYTTNAFSPAANRTLYGAFTSAIAGAPAPSSVTDSRGLVWELVGTPIALASGALLMAVYRTTTGATAPGSGTVTINYATAPGTFTWSIQEWAGLDNAAPVVQSIGATQTSTLTLSATLGAAVAAGNPTIGFASAGTSTITYTAGTGHTLLGVPQVGTSPSISHQGEYALAGQSPVSFGLSATGNGVIFAIEGKAAGVVTPPVGSATLTRRIVGPTGRIKVKTSGAASVRLKIGTDVAVTTGVVYTAAVTPDAQGNSMLTYAGLGLTPGATYYYRVAMTPDGGTEALDTATTVGQFKIAPTGQTNFSFSFSSCENSADPLPVYTRMTAHNDDLFFHLGDLWYADGTGQNIDNFRSRMNFALDKDTKANLLPTRATVHIASDHDALMADSSTMTTVESRDVPLALYNQVHREMIPADVPATGHYQAFAWGRVRFIMLDVYTFASPVGTTDDANKTYLGATQKQWFKDQITNATEPLIIVGSPQSWVGTAGAGAQYWGAYSTERAELASHITAAGKNVAFICGDMHAVAYDDGANSTAYGGFPVMQGAPLRQTSSHKGGPYTHGPFPASGITSTELYGRVIITDTGTAISFNFIAYDEADAQLINVTKSYTVGGGTPTGSATLTGSGDLTTSRTLNVVRPAALSGEGSLTPVLTPKPVQSPTFTGSGALTTTVTPKPVQTVALSGEGSLTGVTVPRPAQAAAFTGEGTMTVALTPRPSPAPVLSGDGTLVAATGLHPTQTAVLTGSGALTVTTVPHPVQPTEFTGSGALTATTIPGATRTAAFAGDGVLAASTTPTPAVVAPLTGAGALTATATPTPVAAIPLTGSGALVVTTTPTPGGTVEFAGSGTLVATTIPVLAAAVTLSGSGALAGSATPTVNAAATFTGSGALVATTTSVVTGDAVLTGSGALTAATAPHQGTAATFTGSGALVATGAPHTSWSAALTGAGTLVAGGDPHTSGAPTFTGSGTLTGATAPQPGVTPLFTGSGALAAAVTSQTTGAATLTGSGALDAAAAPHTAVAAAFTGAGALTAGVTVSVAGVAVLTGSGTLTAAGVPAPVRAVPFTGDGTLTATTVAEAPGAAYLGGAGALTVGVSSTTSTTVGFTGAGALTGSVSPAAGATGVFAGSGSLVASTAITNIGAAAFTGAGALAVTTTLTVARAVTLTGAGSLTTTRTLTAVTTVLFAGSGSLVASTSTTNVTTVALTGTGALTTSTRAAPAAVPMLTGSGALTASTHLSPTPDVLLTGSGSLLVTPIPGWVEQAAFTGAGEVLATLVPSWTRPHALNGEGTLTAQHVPAYQTSGWGIPI